MNKKINYMVYQRFGHYLWSIFRPEHRMFRLPLNANEVQTDIEESIPEFMPILHFILHAVSHSSYGQLI
jgi:hypothetical protein